VSARFGVGLGSLSGGPRIGRAGSGAPGRRPTPSGNEGGGGDGWRWSCRSWPWCAGWWPGGWPGPGWWGARALSRLPGRMWRPGRAERPGEPGPGLGREPRPGPAPAGPPPVLSARSSSFAGPGPSCSPTRKGGRMRRPRTGTAAGCWASWVSSRLGGNRRASTWTRPRTSWPSRRMGARRSWGPTPTWCTCGLLTGGRRSGSCRTGRCGGWVRLAGGPRGRRGTRRMGVCSGSAATGSVVTRSRLSPRRRAGSWTARASGWPPCPGACTTWPPTGAPPWWPTRPRAGGPGPCLPAGSSCGGLRPASRTSSPGGCGCGGGTGASARCLDSTTWSRSSVPSSRGWTRAGW
jgi:hypothetical protein